MRNLPDTFLYGVLNNMRDPIRSPRMAYEPRTPSALDCTEYQVGYQVYGRIMSNNMHGSHVDMNFDNAGGHAELIGSNYENCLLNRADNKEPLALGMEGSEGLNWV